MLPLNLFSDGIGALSSLEVVVLFGYSHTAFSTGPLGCPLTLYPVFCYIWDTSSYLLSLTSLSRVRAIRPSSYRLLLTMRLITGTIGFLASYWAVRKLYSAIRID